MKLNKEHQKIMDEIFNILNTTRHAMKWEIIIPLGFLEKDQYANLYSTETINYLENAFLKLTAIEDPFTKPNQKKIIQISFGKKTIANKAEKKITINFKYAPLLLSIILNSIDSTMLTIKTTRLSYITNIYDFRKKLNRMLK